MKRRLRGKLKTRIAKWLFTKVVLPANLTGIVAE
jgi:hypothetical protein